MTDTPQITDLERQRLEKVQHLQGNLPYFSSQCLQIRTKQGQFAPFVFNKAQRYVHTRVERQKANTGRVRVLILKGRQQGCSTYTAARFFHQTIFHPGTTTFILSHQAKTTGSLFDIVKNYHDFMPSVLAPELDASNQNKMKFAGIKSEYTVGTAGNEEIGRGLTIKLLHCSEAAKYTHTDELETGLFQAVSDMPGTEIIMESTANGMNNMFYRKCMDAMAGRGEYELIFIPWFWQEEYTATPPEDFKPTAAEDQLKAIYNLTDGQIYWRRLKVISLGDEWKFKQEYPMNPMEAFIVSGDSFFKQNLVMDGRKNTLLDQTAPMIAGLDCARTNDRIIMVMRQGRKVSPQIEFEVSATDDISVVVANQCARLIEKFNIVKLFIDYGSGYGIIDILRNAGYRSIVQGVNFGQGATLKQIYANKRAEMYFEARDWLEDGPCDLPDNDDFMSDLLIIPQYKETTGSKKILEKKTVIKSLYGKSPDIADAFVLTFAFPVARNADAQRTTRRTSGNTYTRGRQKPSELSTQNRLRQASRPQPTIVVKPNFHH